MKHMTHDYASREITSGIAVRGECGVPKGGLLVNESSVPGVSEPR